MSFIWCPDSETSLAAVEITISETVKLLHATLLRLLPFFHQ